LSKEYGTNIAPSTYYGFKGRKICKREKKDEILKPLILDIYNDNYKVYGINKIWQTLTNDGYFVGRTTVYRLMRELNIKGAIRGKTKKTNQNKTDLLPNDLVHRKFNSDKLR
jgi:putative transposase